MNRIDYSKVNPWIKKHPKGDFDAFVSANPTITISNWSFRKQRAKVLGLKLTPSMMSGYRATQKNDEDGIIDRRSRSLYNTVYSTPIADLKKKDGIEAASEIIAAINRIFKLHLESAQVEVIGTGVQNFEIRRYGR